VLSSCRVGVAVAVVAPRVVSWVLSSYRGGVTVAVIVFAPHVVSRSRLLGRVGVAVTVFALHVVSRSQSLFLRHVWCCRRRRGLCAVWVLPPPSLRHMWCRGRGHCAACGVAAAVVVPRVVSRLRLWLRSLRHVQCRGRGHCTACGSWSRSLRRVGVTVAVFAPRVVSRPRSFALRVVSQPRSFALRVVSRPRSFVPRAVSWPQSLHHVRCRGRRHCTAWVSRSRSSHRVVLRSWWLSSSCVVPQLWSSSSRRHWTTKEGVSRKKK
jgi:hypothetical protein